MALVEQVVGAVGVHPDGSGRPAVARHLVRDFGVVVAAIADLVRFQIVVEIGFFVYRLKHKNYCKGEP